MDSATNNKFQEEITNKGGEGHRQSNTGRGVGKN